MTMHQETPDRGARSAHGTRKPGSAALRAPAVVGSLVLVILVLGASAGAYALTRSPDKGNTVQIPAQAPVVPLSSATP
jgi:hypothetical protein